MKTRLLVCICLLVVHSVSCRTPASSGLNEDIGALGENEAGLREGDHVLISVTEGKLAPATRQYLGIVKSLFSGRDHQDTFHDAGIKSFGLFAYTPNSNDPWSGEWTEQSVENFSVNIESKDTPTKIVKTFRIERFQITSPYAEFAIKSFNLPTTQSAKDSRYFVRLSILMEKPNEWIDVSEVLVPEPGKVQSFPAYLKIKAKFVSSSMPAPRKASHTAYVRFKKRIFTSNYHETPGVAFDMNSKVNYMTTCFNNGKMLDQDFCILPPDYLVSGAPKVKTYARQLDVKKVVCQFRREDSGDSVHTWNELRSKPQLLYFAEKNESFALTASSKLSRSEGNFYSPKKQIDFITDGDGNKIPSKAWVGYADFQNPRGGIQLACASSDIFGFDDVMKAIGAENIEVIDSPSYLETPDADIYQK